MQTQNLSSILTAVAMVENWELPRAQNGDYFQATELIAVNPEGISQWYPLWFCLSRVLEYHTQDEPRYIILCQSISRILEQRLLYFGVNENQELARRPALVEIRLLKSFQEYEEESLRVSVLDGLVKQILITAQSSYFGPKTPLCVLVLTLFLMRQRQREIPALDLSLVQGFFSIVQRAMQQVDEGLKSELQNLLVEWIEGKATRLLTPQEKQDGSSDDREEIVEGGEGARRQAVRISRLLRDNLEDSVRDLRIVEKFQRFHTERNDFARPRFGTALAHLQMLPEAQELPIQDFLWLSEWILSVTSPNQAFLHSRIPRNRLVCLAIHSRIGIHILIYMHIEYEVGKSAQILPRNISIREVLENLVFASSDKLPSAESLVEKVKECLHQFLARLEHETDLYRRNGSGAI